MRLALYPISIGACGACRLDRQHTIFLVAVYVRRVWAEIKYTIIHDSSSTFYPNFP